MEQTLLRILSIGTFSTLPIILLAVFGAIFPHAPRRLISTLWKVLWIRLLLPFSVFDLLPLLPSKLSADSNFGNEVVSAVASPIASFGNAGGSPGRFQLLQVLAYVWALGAAAMLAVLAIRLLALKRRLSTATLLSGKVYQSDRIGEPIVFGLFAPKIYLPYSIGENEKKYAVLHESAHIKHRDDLWLVIGRIAADIYWFCPLIWPAYAIFRHDIELGCDETVSKSMSTTERSEYCIALLSYSAGNGRLLQPITHFGGGILKRRIRLIMKRSRKNHLFVLLLGIVLAASVACTSAAPVSPLAASAMNAGNRAEKYPEYQNMDTSNGVRVLVYKMAADSFDCNIVPAGVKIDFVQALNLHPLTADEVVELLDSLGIADSAVTVHPYRNIRSSYYLVADSKFSATVSELFGGRYAIGEQLSLKDITDIPANQE